MTVTLKAIKPFLEGTPIPVEVDDAHRGKYIEKLYVEKGFDVNTGLGADFADAKIDIKSRKLESNSAHTITACTEKHIIEKNYKNSNVYPKIQQWDQPIYSESYNEIVRHESYDFRDEFVQSIIETGYEDCRKQIIEGAGSNYIRSENDYVIFERVSNKDNTWQVRFPHSSMKKLKSMCKQVAHNTLFEET